MVLGEFSTMADDGYEKVCKIKSLLAECMVPPRESQFLNLDRYIEEENEVSFIPDPPNWCNISFRGFQERVLTYRPQHWGADPNAVLWFSKYGWRCTEKFAIKCDICSSTIECSSLIQKPDLWGDVAHKAHDNLCYWSFCPSPDRFIQIITHPKILCKNICQNWQKIITYGIELPKIQQIFLDKMGLTRDILDHLFRIIESSFSEVGMSALILVICGWLKSSEDKTLECAYCQRHLALRHFFSIAEISKVNESVPVQDAVFPGNEAAKMEISETAVCRDLPSETDRSTSVNSIGDKTELVLTLQQRKKARTHPAIFVSTALHRARATAWLNKQKLPSFRRIFYLKYGVTVPEKKGSQKKKRGYARKCSGRKHSGNDKNVSATSMADRSDSANEKPSQESNCIDKTDSEQCASTSNGTSLGDNKRKVPGDQDSESMEASDTEKLWKVTEVISEIGNNNNPSMIKDIDTVTNVKCGTEDTLHPESEDDGCVSEMVRMGSNSQDALREVNMMESNLPATDQNMSTNVHELEEAGVALSLNSKQSGAGTNLAEVSSAEERTETIQRSVVPDFGKDGLNVGKRHLVCDDGQQSEGTTKRMKIGSEQNYLKKKDLNPMNEHRFWCIWKIKTVDRLLGSPKEGWRQILDLLKFGVSPQNSDEEDEAMDLFEEVKKIHFMMSGW